MFRYMNVMDAMTKMPVVVGPDASVKECVELMLKFKVGSLIIQENKILKGIVTEKDLVEKMILDHLDPKKTKISSIMSDRVTTVYFDSDIMEAVKIMTKKDIRRLPVVDKNNKLVGLLTINDVLRIQPEMFEIILDKSRLFASTRKHIDSKCDSCKTYGLVRLINGKFLCDDCERNERVINYLN